MINKLRDSWDNIFHAGCKRDREKLECKHEDLESVVAHLTRENHELKVIYNYQVMEFEQSISQLRQSYEEQQSINFRLLSEINRVNESTQIQGV